MSQIVSTAILDFRTLSTTVNLIKSPNQFLMKLLFANKNSIPTETIEWATFSANRDMAPFIRKNGAAIMVPGVTGNANAISGPNIRLKRPFTPSQLLFGRQPDNIIFVQNDQEQVSNAERVIARDLQYLSNMIANAEEWMAAMSLRGQVKYEVTDQESFQITYNRPSANNITLSIFWDAVDPTTVNPALDFLAVKRVLAEWGFAATDAILGSEAVTAFLNWQVSTRGIALATTNRESLILGTTTFAEKFSDDGVLYLGTYGGIRVWEYSRSVNIAGVATPLIRAKYAEFVCANQATETEMTYAAIADFKALKGKLFQAPRFSKSWEEEDPSALMYLVHSRPFPNIKRPEAFVSVKVVSG